MEEDEIQAQACKFPRVGHGRNESNKIGSSKGNEQHQDGGGSDGSTNHHFQSSWQHHSSRIIRVSRASGGKDRHSKVMTSKGLRDRRVRLSVTTAIQFYDLQDRLGCDQPSKAVEWLIKAASDAISELPSLNNNPFLDTPKQPSDDKRPSDQQQGFDGDNNTNYQQNQSQNLSLSNSACSSTSETSKGSGLSLSRSEIRVKARERARERAAKEKEKEKEKENNNESSMAHHHQHDVNVNHPMSHTASFTELLTGGIGSTVTVPTTTNSPNGSVHQIHGGQDEANLFNKGRQQQQQQQHWSSAVPMDYFSSGLLVGPSSSSRTQQQHSSGFTGGQIQLGHALPFSGENHSDQLQQHFSFIPEHLIPAMVTSSSAASASSQHSGNDYNLNFTRSSGLAGYNRGTLQSNSPSLLPHLQRFQPLDGSSNIPFFIGAPASATNPTMDDNNNNNHHHHHLQFSPVFDGRLQLRYADGSRHSDHKGKAKN